MTEKVLCVPTELITKFEGFSNNRDYDKIIFGPETVNIIRSVAERSPEYKQIIPYVVFMNEDKIFRYQRKGGGESRLEGKWSIGVGGHIDSADETYLCALAREIYEEVSVVGGDSSPFTIGGIIGYINEDQTDVGKVHFGVLHLTEGVDIVAKENKLINAGMCQIEQIKSEIDKLELWSQIALQAVLAYKGYQ